MKEKKIGFWSFFRLLFAGSGGRYPAFFEGQPGVLAALLLSLGCLSYLGGNGAGILAIFGIYATAAIALCYGMTRKMPSLVNLVPISPKRKTVYLFLSMALSTLFLLLFSTLILIVSMLIIALCVFVASGQNAFLMDTGGSGPALCAQGYGMDALLFLFFVGMALLFTSIEDGRWRTALTLSMPLFFLVPLRIIMAACGIERGNLFISFDQMPYSYIYLIVYGIIGVALTVKGTIRLISKEIFAGRIFPSRK